MFPEEELEPDPCCRFSSSFLLPRERDSRHCCEEEHDHERSSRPPSGSHPQRAETTSWPSCAAPVAQKPRCHTPPTMRCRRYTEGTNGAAEDSSPFLHLTIEEVPVLNVHGTCRCASFGSAVRAKVLSPSSAFALMNRFTSAAVGRRPWSGAVEQQAVYSWSCLSFFSASRVQGTAVALRVRCITSPVQVSTDRTRPQAPYPRKDSLKKSCSATSAMSTSMPSSPSCTSCLGQVSQLLVWIFR